VFTAGVPRIRQRKSVAAFPADACPRSSQLPPPCWRECRADVGDSPRIRWGRPLRGFPLNYINRETDYRRSICWQSSAIPSSQSCL
jgi:hypothetical protein